MAFNINNVINCLEGDVSKEQRGGGRAETVPTGNGDGLHKAGKVWDDDEEGESDGDGKKEEEADEVGESG